MKKFKFSLESILKIKEFDEKRCKLELGNLIKKKEEIYTTINKLENELDRAFLFRSSPNETISGKFLLSLPNVISGKRLLLEKEKEKINRVEEEIESKKKELVKSMGDKQTYVNLKEKELIKYKKYREKKISEEIEENYMMNKNRIRSI